MELLDHGSSIFNFLRKLHTIFITVGTNLHPYQKCTRVSLFTTSLPTFIIFDDKYFDDSHSEGSEVISHCSFDLPLSGL